MDYTNIRLHLGTDLKSYFKTIPCDTFEQVEYELNRAELYDKYMVVAFSLIEKCDKVIAMGRIEPNRINYQDKTYTRKGR